MQKQVGIKSENGRLLTIKRAHEIYDLDTSLLYWWVRYEKFDCYKIGKKIVFWERDFLKFLEEHRVERREDLENKTPLRERPSKARAETGANDEKNITTS